MRKTGTTEAATRVAYSVKEIALASGKTTNAVYLQIQAGKIRTSRMGNRHLVPASYFAKHGLSLPAADKES